MGSFNMHGFVSDLPIEFDDEIYVFPCAMYPERMYKNQGMFDDTILYPFDNGIVPICGPIRGKYNDYGSIEDYDENNPTVQIIQNLTGMTLDKIIQLHKDNEFVSISTKRRSESIYQKDVLKKFFTCKDWIYEDDYKEIVFTILFEHAAVVDHMVEMSEHRRTWRGKVDVSGNVNKIIELYYKYEDIHEKCDSIFQSFDNSIYMIISLIESGEWKNPESTFSNEYYVNLVEKYKDRVKEMEEDIEYIQYNKLGYIDSGFGSEYFPPFAYALYHQSKVSDYWLIADDLAKIFKFNRMMHDLTRYYRVSPGGHQDEPYKEMMSLIELSADIMKNKLTKYDEDDEEDDYSSESLNSYSDINSGSRSLKI